MSVGAGPRAASLLYAVDPRRVGVFYAGGTALAGARARTPSRPRPAGRTWWNAYNDAA